MGRIEGTHTVGMGTVGDNPVGGEGFEPTLNRVTKPVPPRHRRGGPKELEPQGLVPEGLQPDGDYTYGLYLFHIRTGAKYLGCTNTPPY